MIIKTLFINENLIKAGKQRQNEWELGWSENLKNLKFNNVSEIKNSLTPKYFNKYNAVRFNNKLIKPTSLQFEKNTLLIILFWLFDKYARKFKNIYEFGCGTGHNLLTAHEVNPKAKLYGLDWAKTSQLIISKLKKKIKSLKISGYKFDYFNPNKNFKIKKNSLIYTVASLEQIGNQSDKFISYLLKQAKSLVIHVEPIAELLPEDNLLCFLSRKYFEKRNYLKNYLTRLRKLQDAGKVEIILEKRTKIGSLFIEGYSVVIWKKI